MYLKFKIYFLKINKLAKFIFIYLIISINVLAFSQQTFYIDPSSNTSDLELVRDGVRAINNNMTEDIIVILKNGKHILDRTFELNELDGGTNGFKVIWKAETKGQVSLSGGESINGWDLYDTANNIYRTYVGSSDFRQIYVNGLRGIRARTPNTDGEIGLGPYNRTLDVNIAAKTISINANEITNWSNLSDVEMVFYPSWYHYRLKINNFKISNSKAIVSFPEDDIKWGFKKPTLYYINAPYFFENAYEFIDNEGEWYLNKEDSYLYYKPRIGENMSTAEVIIPKVKTLLYIKGENAKSMVSNISFDGITFEHTNWTRPSESGLIATQAFQPMPLEYDDGSMDESIRPPGAVRVDYGEFINFYNNTFTSLGANGLVYFIGGKNCEIDYNTFEKIAGNGIIVDAFNKRSPNSDEVCKYFNITNNTLQYLGLDYTNSIGLLANFVQDLSFTNNKIAHIPYTGVQIGNQGGDIYRGTSNIFVAFNDISDFTNIHTDGGGIYTLGHQPICIIKENYIHDWSRTEWESKAAPSAGVYLDNFGKYIVIDHNYYSGYDPLKPRTHSVFLQFNTFDVFAINDDSNDICIVAGAGPGNENNGCQSLCDLPEVPEFSNFRFNSVFWNKVQGASGYLLWISREESGRYTEYIDVGDVDEYPLLDTNGILYFAIQAYGDNISCRSDLSKEVIVKASANVVSILPNPVIENVVSFVFLLEKESFVELFIFDIQGRVLKTVKRVLDKGDHKIEIGDFRSLKTGMYFYRIKSDEFNVTGKLLFE